MAFLIAFWEGEAPAEPFFALQSFARSLNLLVAGESLAAPR